MAGRVTDAPCGSLLVDLRPVVLETAANLPLILLIVDVRDLADLCIRAMTPRVVEEWLAIHPRIARKGYFASASLIGMDYKTP